MLADHSVYLRLSTYHDLIYDGTHALILDMLDEWSGGAFEHFQDLAVRGRPREVTAELLMEKVHGLVGEGIHQTSRWRMWREAGSPVRSFEFNAGAHPYTGVFHTTIDIRLERSWFERNPEAAPRVCLRRFKRLAALTHPFQGHVHDTDDNSTQNIDNPALLRRGFGLEVEGPVALEDNPGRELSRGEFRYVINWLTLIGPALLERFPPEALLSAPATEVTELEIDPSSRRTPAEEVARRMGHDPEALKEGPQRWLMLRLGDSPLGFDNPERRAVQAAVREHLGLREQAHKERYMLGYWQRKK